MTEETEASVLGSLPHSRPQRRSAKRAARPAEEQQAEPGSEPEVEERSAPCTVSIAEGAELLGTVVKATAELVEIGLTVGTRALRIALSRLPKP